MSSHGSLSGKSISTGSRKSSRSSSSGASVKSGRENGSKRGNGRRKSNESARVLSETDQSRSSGKTSKSDGRLDQTAVTSSDTSQSKVRTESGESRERMLRESLHKIQDKNDGTEADHLQITDKRKVSGDNLPSETASEEGGDHGVEKSIVDGAAEGIKEDSAGELTEIHSVKRVSVEKIESAENAGVPEQSSRKSSGEFRSDAEEDGKLKTRSDDETESNKPTSDNDETGTKSEEKIESSEAKPNGQTVQEPPREDEDAKNDDDTLSDGKESKSEIKKESTVGLNEDRSTEKIDSADKNISIDAIKPGESDDRSTEKTPSEVLDDVKNGHISKHSSSDKADSTVSADDKSERDVPSEEKIEAGANGEHGEIPANDESSSKVEKGGDGERAESEGESNTEDTEVDKTDVDQSHDVEKRESTTEVDKTSKEDISTGVKLESSESATGEVEILDADRHTDDDEAGKVDSEDKSESASESAEPDHKPNIGSADKVGAEIDESKEADIGETTLPDKDVDHTESDSAVIKRESKEATEVETKVSVRDAVTCETGDGAEYESPSTEVGSVGPLTSDTSTKVPHASASDTQKNNAEETSKTYAVASKDEIDVDSTTKLDQRQDSQPSQGGSQDSIDESKGLELEKLSEDGGSKLKIESDVKVVTIEHEDEIAPSDENLIPHVDEEPAMVSDDIVKTEQTMESAVEPEVDDKHYDEGAALIGDSEAAKEKSEIAMVTSESATKELQTLPEQKGEGEHHVDEARDQTTESSYDEPRSGALEEDFYVELADTDTSEQQVLTSLEDDITDTAFHVSELSDLEEEDEETGPKDGDVEDFPRFSSDQTFGSFGKILFTRSFNERSIRSFPVITEDSAIDQMTSSNSVFSPSVTSSGEISVCSTKFSHREFRLARLSLPTRRTIFDLRAQSYRAARTDKDGIRRYSIGGALMTVPYIEYPLDCKVPMASAPQNNVEFVTTQLGEPLYRAPEGLEFDGSAHGVISHYKALHDPHLKNFFNKPAIRDMLIRKGFITKSAMVKCSLPEINAYRAWIKEIELEKFCQEQRIQHEEEMIEKKTKQEQMIEMRKTDGKDINHIRQKVAREARLKELNKINAAKSRLEKMEEAETLRRGKYNEERMKKCNLAEARRERERERRKGQQHQHELQETKQKQQLLKKRAQEDAKRAQMLQSQKLQKREEKKKQLEARWQRRQKSLEQQRRMEFEIRKAEEMQRFKGIRKRDHSIRMMRQAREETFQKTKEAKRKRAEEMERQLQQNLSLKVEAARKRWEQERQRQRRARGVISAGKGAPRKPLPLSSSIRKSNWDISETLRAITIPEPTTFPKGSSLPPISKTSPSKETKIGPEVKTGITRPMASTLPRSEGEKVTSQGNGKDETGEKASIEGGKTSTKLEGAELEEVLSKIGLVDFHGAIFKVDEETSDVLRQVLSEIEDMHGSPKRVSSEEMDELDEKIGKEPYESPSLEMIRCCAKEIVRSVLETSIEIVRKMQLATTSEKSLQDEDVSSKDAIESVDGKAEDHGPSLSGFEAIGDGVTQPNDDATIIQSDNKEAMLNVDETAPSSSGHAVISDLPSVINVLHAHGSGSLHGGVDMPSVSVLPSDEEEESEDEIVGLVENDVIGHQSIDQMEGPIDFDEGLGSGSVATLLSEREMEGSAIIINEDEIIEPLRDKEGNLVITPLVHHNVVHLKEDIVGENLGTISVKEGEAAKDQSGTGVPAARNSFRNIFRPDLTHSRGSARCLQQKIVSSCISSGVSSLASDKIMELDEDAEPHAGVLPRHDSSETILNVAETEGVCYLPKRYIYQTGQEKSDSGGVTTCTKNGSGEKVAGPSDSDGKMAAPSELGGEVLEASTSGEKVAAPSESGGKVTSTSGSDVKTVISTGNDRETARTSTTDVEVTKTSSSNLKDTATRSALVEIACRDETITKTSITSPAETSSTSLKHGKSTSSGQKLIKSRSSGIKVTETSGTSLKDDKSTSRTKKVARTSSTGVKVADTSRTSVKGAKFSSSDVKVTKTASTGVKVGETSGISVKDAKSSTSDKKFVKTSSTGVKVTKTSSSGSKVAKTSGTSMKHARSSSSDKKVARTSSTGMKVAKTSSTSAKPAKSSSTGLKVKKTSQSGLKVAKSSSSGAKTTRSAQKVTEASSDHKQIAKTGSQVTETGSSAGKLSVSSGTSQKDTANAVSGSKIGDIPTSDTKVEDSHDAKSEKSTSVIETTETRGIHDRKDTDTTLSHTKSHSHPDVSQLEKLDTVASDSDEEENVLRQIYSSHRHLRERPPSPIPSDDNIRRPSHQVFHHGSALLSPITSELSLTETDGPEGTVDSNVSVDSQSEPPLEAREGESAVETGEVAKTEEGSSLETHPEITQSSHLPPGTSDNTESGSQHSRLHSDSSLKDKEGAAS